MPVRTYSTKSKGPMAKSTNPKKAAAKKKTSSKSKQSKKNDRYDDYSDDCSCSDCCSSCSECCSCSDSESFTSISSGECKKLLAKTKARKSTKKRISTKNAKVNGCKANV